MLYILIPIILLFPFPPPWVPAQPLQGPIRIEYAGLASIEPFIRADGEVMTFNPRGERRCYRISAYDAAGQEYHHQDLKQCGLVTWVPLVVNQ